MPWGLLNFKDFISVNDSQCERKQLLKIKLQKEDKVQQSARNIFDEAGKQTWTVIIMQTWLVSISLLSILRMSDDPTSLPLAINVSGESRVMLLSMTVPLLFKLMLSISITLMKTVTGGPLLLATRLTDLGFVLPSAAELVPSLSMQIWTMAEVRLEEGNVHFS